VLIRCWKENSRWRNRLSGIQDHPSYRYHAGSRRNPVHA